MSKHIKYTIVTVWMLAILAGIAFLFWHNEWKYSLPTPVPCNYSPVNMGDYVSLSVMHDVDTSKPLFLHFFNPECPCSRFNLPYFRSLIKKYRAQFSFAVIVEHTVKRYTAAELQNKYDLDIPVLFDDGIAAACGVYSTPQAAIVGKDHRLFYRGNYNRARYCTDPRTNFAQTAIDSFLQHTQLLSLGQAAFVSYGCQLNQCNKK